MPIRTQSHFSRLVAACMIAFLLAVTAFPVPGRAFFFGGVTLKDEREMGHKFDVLIRSNLPMVEDPEVREYVKGLVDRIVKAIPPQPYTFKPGVILHNALNAFAVPGGYVYVFTGLLMNFNSEEEVAGVLCHELAHVTQRHVASRLERAQMVTLGSLLLAVAGIAAGGAGAGSAGAAIATTSLAAGQAAMLGYSRADETESDQIGLQFLIKAGFPPLGMVNGFRVLRQKSMMNGTSVPAYLSTHPDIGDRINGIQARIKTMPASIQNRKNDNSRFARMQVLLWGRYGYPQTALQRFRGTDALSLMGQGMIHSRENRIAEATRAFTQAVAKAPGDPLVLREAGIFHYRKGDINTARQLLAKAVSLDGHDYMAHFFLARLQDDAGDSREAQRSFANVLRYVSDDAEVHEAIAKSYGRSGNRALAYIHMTYAALYAQKKDLAKRYHDKARSLSGSAPGDFRKLDSIYKERTEIWKKM